MTGQFHKAGSGFIGRPWKKDRLRRDVFIFFAN
jgi:hypothetical protein